MATRVGLEDVMRAIRSLADEGRAEVSSTEVTEALQGSSATVRCHLDRLVAAQRVSRTGAARATRYRLAEPVVSMASVPGTASRLQTQFDWSVASRRLASRLEVPLAAREPVTYQREFVDRYVPNKTALMPQALAEELYRAGRMQGQLPAGTYARKVLEQLLIDLSWSSSRLEGNRYSLLATE